jgi:hypothetical protein
VLVIAEMGNEIVKFGYGMNTILPICIHTLLFYSQLFQFTILEVHGGSFPMHIYAYEIGLQFP